MLVLILAVAGCTAPPPNAKPLSPTFDIITPEGNKVPCNMANSGICMQL
jgi:hypothetical protein